MPSLDEITPPLVALMPKDTPAAWGGRALSLVAEGYPESVAGIAAGNAQGAGSARGRHGHPVSEQKRGQAHQAN